MIYPPMGKPSRRNHHFVSGEKRQDRLKEDNFKARLQTLYAMCNGKAETLKTLKEAENSWAKNIPKVEKGNTELAFQLFTESLEHGDPHQLIKDWSDQLTLKYNKPVNFCLPFLRFNVWNEKKEVEPHLWLVLNNPDDHIRICEQHTSKSPNLGATNYGNNFLAHVNNDEWRRRRFGMIFAVSPRVNKTYFKKMERHTKLLIQDIENGIGGQFFYGQTKPDLSFNIHSMIEHTAFSIACDCLYDVDDHTIKKWSQKLRWALQVTNRESSPQARKILKGWTRELMNRPVPSGLNGPLLQGLHDIGEDYPSEKTPKEHPQSPVVGDVSILTLAMHDTTASTMTWTLAELARRPDLQNKLFEEIQIVQSKKSKDEQTLNYDDLYNMPLITKVINETLRLYPAVSYGTQRQLEKDEYIFVPSNSGEKDKKILIPKGTNCIIHNFSNHRNKKLWGNDANEWKPERWTGYGDVNSFNFDGPSGADGWETTYSARNPQSKRFHPFTRAPRQCFGMNFAQLEMRVVLPLLISKFEFTLAEPTHTKVISSGMISESYEIAGILKPRDGLWLHCKSRMKPKM